MQDFVRPFDEDSGRCSMKYRIALWAAAGYLVASGWELFLGAAGHPLELDCVYPVRLTTPLRLSAYITRLASIRLLLQMSTYALVGLVVETLRRRQLNHSD